MRFFRRWTRRCGNFIHDKLDDIPFIHSLMGPRWKTAVADLVSSDSYLKAWSFFTFITMMIVPGVLGISIWLIFISRTTVVYLKDVRRNATRDGLDDFAAELATPIHLVTAALVFYFFIVFYGSQEFVWAVVHWRWRNRNKAPEYEKSAEENALDYRVLFTIILYNLCRIPPVALVHPRWFPESVKVLPGSIEQQRFVLPAMSGKDHSLGNIVNAMFYESAIILGLMIFSVISTIFWPAFLDYAVQGTWPKVSRAMTFDIIFFGLTQPIWTALDMPISNVCFQERYWHWTEKGIWEMMKPNPNDPIFSISYAFTKGKLLPMIPNNLYPIIKTPVYNLYYNARFGFGTLAWRVWRKTTQSISKDKGADVELDDVSASNSNIASA